MPVIVGITGHVLGEYQELGTKAGMSDILPKPVHINNLRQHLAKVDAVLKD
jgi:CheY-like chemotaxis protein